MLALCAGPLYKGPEVNRAQSLLRPQVNRDHWGHWGFSFCPFRSYFLSKALRSLCLGIYQDTEALWDCVQEEIYGVWKLQFESPFAVYWLCLGEMLKCFFFFFKDYFLGKFYVSCKIESQEQRFPTYPHTCTASFMCLDFLSLGLLPFEWG